MFPARRRGSQFAIALVLSVVLVATLVLAGCGAEATLTPEPAADAPAQSTPAPTEPAAATGTTTLTVWWWGEQEIPGAEQWMKETVIAYEQANPNIKINAVLQPTDQLLTAFKSAAAAKTGPDIQFLWGGKYTLDEVVEGNLAPISDYLPPEAFTHVLDPEERLFDGKIWGMGWYMLGTAMVYNKKMFAEAGLDPESPPQTWDELMTACGRLKEAGFAPWVIGIKDGWHGAWLNAYLGSQAVDSPDDLKLMAIGDRNYTDKPYAEWWNRVDELWQNGCINSDVNSLDLYQGTEAFYAGKGAMTMGSDGTLLALIPELGEENVGVMQVPVWGKGALAGKYHITAQTMAITSWSPHKQEAADFLNYFHDLESIYRWQRITNAFYSDDRMDPNLVQGDQAKTMFEWLVDKDNTVMWCQDIAPFIVEEQAHWAGVQLLFAGQLTPEEGAALEQQMVEQWRKENPDGPEQYRRWLTGQ